MNWRKHMVLLVGGGLAAVLLLAAVVMLLRFQGRYAAVNRELEGARQRLEVLKARDPFPSEDNVQRLRQNRSDLQSVALQILEQLHKNQRAVVPMEPAEFAPSLERTSRQLVQRAQESGVTLPEGFGFGFARYAAGELPAPAAVPRLVKQLSAVEALCDVLFQARIAKLDELEREVFDETEAATEGAPQEGRRARRGAAERTPTVSQVPLAEPNELYEVERLTLTFEARESAVWDVLNGIVRSPNFMAIADLRMENTLATTGALGKKKPVAALGGDAAANIQPQYPSHDDRVVAGRELVTVSLMIDVYHFKEVFAAEVPR